MVTTHAYVNTPATRQIYTPSVISLVMRIYWVLDVSVQVLDFSDNYFVSLACFFFVHSASLLLLSSYMCSQSLGA